MEPFILQLLLMGQASTEKIFRQVHKIKQLAKLAFPSQKGNIYFFTNINLGMKQDVSISISSPCGEKWSSFQPTSDGGFCLACQKNVIDFTHMSEKEIADYFLQKPIGTCGRFRTEQLKTYQKVSPSHFSKNWNWLKTGLLGMSLLLFTKESQAQTPKPIAYVQKEKDQAVEKQKHVSPHLVIQGVVKDEEGEVLPGVNIFVKGTTKGTRTDIDGKFSLSAQQGDILMFMFIGFLTKEYVVPNQPPNKLITLTMEMDEFELMGEVAVHEVYQEPSKWSMFRGKLTRLFR